MAQDKFLSNIKDPNSVVMAIDKATRFPEILEVTLAKYKDAIEDFSKLVREVATSGELLERIRSSEFTGKKRMALLKMFRRAVAPVIDTEMAKKVSSVPTKSLIDNYGATFKPIELLKKQFAALSPEGKGALAALIGEYDTRGQIGYSLTGLFFDWFETEFENLMTIEGPRGAGRDIELSTVLRGFVGEYPCDFVIRKAKTREVLAVGFARYDATRGGAQSDDRTGGNAYKVAKAREYCEKSGDQIRIVFLADGPGLAHGDTWRAAVDLDGEWEGNVRVTTMKLADQRVTADWLMRVAST
ncbi:hypothetical protein [Mesorhizobium sp. BR-1-1-10]|uniref:hypothetical protein n=1 Tax=Mesorhizobium sp. BR-1-1-10 TaxID=2876660 RepID=UPI001CD150C7|nr:hypothetical protein [Mesorhizobium sp. BR-1-1-10]MBZ9975967.1 hypothetical protein [Mesorhizobium sp. BR-1-1-10]